MKESALGFADRQASARCEIGPELLGRAGKSGGEGKGGSGRKVRAFYLLYCSTVLPLYSLPPRRAGGGKCRIRLHLVAFQHSPLFHGSTAPHFSGAAGGGVFA
jgi:hypothetical protein